MNVVVDGRLLGTVTVLSVQHPATVGGKTAGTGMRWLALHIRYDAADDLHYDPKDWSIDGANGLGYSWAGVDLEPALGEGTLKAGDTRTGNVTFEVPRNGALWLVFDGGDGEQRLQLVQLPGQ